MIYQAVLKVPEETNVLAKDGTGQPVYAVNNNPPVDRSFWVQLTQDGADFVNDGNPLPPVSLVDSQGSALDYDLVTLEGEKRIAGEVVATGITDALALWDGPMPTHGTGHYQMGDDAFAALASLTPEWPDVKPFPSTRAHNGYELVHALIETPSDDPASLIDMMITIFSLDWELLSFDTPHAHLPYDDEGLPILVEVDTGELDEQGNPILQMQHVAEQIVEREMPAATMLLHMQDEYDDSDPPVASRPTVARVPHKWAGLLPIALEVV